LTTSALLLYTLHSPPPLPLASPSPPPPPSTSAIILALPPSLDFTRACRSVSPYLQDISSPSTDGLSYASCFILGVHDPLSNRLDLSRPAISTVSTLSIFRSFSKPGSVVSFESCTERRRDRIICSLTLHIDHSTIEPCRCRDLRLALHHDLSEFLRNITTLIHVRFHTIYELQYRLLLDRRRPTAEEPTEHFASTGKLEADALSASRILRLLKRCDEVWSFYRTRTKKLDHGTYL
jgi:hypothetical protein